MKWGKIAESLGLALALMAISLTLAWAGRAGLIDNEIPTRITMALSGLLIAHYGNMIPKMIIRTARGRAVRRFAGWIMVLAGLTSAGFWALAPLKLATNVSLVTIGGAVALVLLTCLGARLTAPPTRNTGN